MDTQPMEYKHVMFKLSQQADNNMGIVSAVEAERLMGILSRDGWKRVTSHVVSMEGSAINVFHMFERPVPNGKK
jgi:hypothetical protein